MPAAPRPTRKRASSGDRGKAWWFASRMASQDSIDITSGRQTTATTVSKSFHCTWAPS